MKVVFAREAETDLEAIGDFIASECPAQALAFVQALRRRCERLADMPRRFPPRAEL
ncbi:type II toxin-antitoxin system RelE/ParE family toxin [Methylocystis sp. WRRC1]|uniref:type II toxin-antitoxin system RelE/ParE family toxin n=1 Tax=Methylocystis sp. WRRC1 TaxID=1732014 RepID=UPI00351CBD9D